MPRKGLIIYASHTGNTEKVALSFKKVFEDQGWECDCVKATKNMKSVNPDDYDLVCIGSPILAGVPAREVNDVWMRGGAYRDDEAGSPPEGDFPEGGPPPFSLSWRPDPTEIKKGIAFVTYTGSQRGPSEAIPALDLIELQLETKGYRCIGKLACPGKIARHNAPASEQQGDRPEGPEEMREWHWNQQSRPHERDLQKAETFLAEILEDYFLPTEVYPGSQYICIA